MNTLEEIPESLLSYVNTVMPWAMDREIWKIILRCLTNMTMSAVALFGSGVTMPSIREGPWMENPCTFMEEITVSILMTAISVWTAWYTRTEDLTLV